MKTNSFFLSNFELKIIKKISLAFVFFLIFQSFVYAQFANHKVISNNSKENFYEIKSGYTSIFNMFSREETYTDGHRVYVKNNQLGPVYLPSHTILPTGGSFALHFTVQANIAGKYYLNIKDEPPLPWNPWFQTFALNETVVVEMKVFAKENFAMGINCPNESSYPTKYLVLEAKERVFGVDIVHHSKNIQLIVDADAPDTKIL